MSAAALELSGICKTFHAEGRAAVQAVRDVSLRLAPGEIYGFLGPNGAGKTTTVRCALGLIPLDAGRVMIFGQPPGNRRNLFRQVGFCPDSFVLPRELTSLEHLSFFARLYGMDPTAGRKQAEKWIHRLGLSKVAGRPAGQLSLGNRQRLLIAQALIGSPKLLFLDEPTQGLDPLGIQDLRGLLRELADQGVAVFLNSHRLAEVEKVCDRIGILHEGRLVREDTLDGLMAAGGMERTFIDVVKGE